MKRYIDRELALSNPFANGHYDKEHADKNYILGMEMYKKWLEQLPTADVVEVVRCKYCKWRFENKICYGREWPIQKVPDDGFCDKGEKKRRIIS